MLLLTSITDILTVQTSAAGLVEAHASWIDNASGTVTPGRINTPDITTAVVTTIVPAPAASAQRNIKHLNIHNKSLTVTNVIAVTITDGTTANDLIRCTLLPDETLVLDQEGKWTHYTADALVKTNSNLVVYNASSAAQTGFAADTYLAGSFVVFPVPPRIGTKYKLKFDVTKTAAGVATPIINVRLGIAGTIADVARNTLTFLAQTAVVDNGMFEIEGVFRAVGAAAIFQARSRLTHEASITGLSTLVSSTRLVASTFDSTIAGLGIGVSVNGGASAAWTVQLVEAELCNV